MARSLQQMAQDFMNLERFDGVNFCRWQKKMHFLLTTLNVAYVLTTPYPEEKEDETLAEQRTRTKWENDDYICKGHILNALGDSLFDVYQYVETAKELWDALETKYISNDATSKKVRSLLLVRLCGLLWLMVDLLLNNSMRSCIFLISFDNKIK